MKKTFFPLSLIVASVLVWSCNNDSSTATTETTDSSTHTTDNTANMDTTNNMSTPSTMSSGPVDPMDTTFVSKAATGGMEEVMMANVAMQNASSQRVKDFATMMIQDHSKANNELKSIASAKSITVPADLTPEQQKDMDMIKKKTGKDFDKAYMDMMLKDHKKDVGEFEKASTNLKDADLKGFATKTLPVLKTHLDSAQAISKMKM